MNKFLSILSIDFLKHYILNYLFYTTFHNIYIYIYIKILMLKKHSLIFLCVSKIFSILKNMYINFFINFFLFSSQIISLSYFFIIISLYQFTQQQ